MKGCRSCQSSQIKSGWMPHPAEDRSANQRNNLSVPLPLCLTQNTPIADSGDCSRTLTSAAAAAADAASADARRMDCLSGSASPGGSPRSAPPAPDPPLETSPSAPPPTQHNPRRHSATHVWSFLEHRAMNYTHSSPLSFPRCPRARSPWSTGTRPGRLAFGSDRPNHQLELEKAPDSP